ncbi:ribosomal-protein-alanine N-acetyltransferase [Deferribacter autotrophicus]|uniref:[Ribosomal protein bS18]-alanine N-acetyltransferase n=1 Tax=Deferribacter autotrophicus TaxID=500465 RepID=A0A5A8F2A5_9BACT|nr:ribosomal protein S18-alanine N-acetyltransferase [Deferribacter autotrophicus]KAA0258072.1 ribosomal-protein-alanine N-acetyltransferase [Deferribacter autotrophicus]
MIKPAVYDDLKKIYAIEMEVYDTPWSYESFVKEFYNPCSQIYVYEYNKSIIGFVVIWDLGNEVEIANIAVSKSYQGQGVGGKLLEFVLDSKGDAVFYLEVEEGNKAARRLYTKFGFIEYGKRLNYYGLGKHAILMKLKKG